MATINQEDIFLILKLLDESNFDEIHLEAGEIKLHVKKQGFSNAWDKEDKDETASPATGMNPAAITPSMKGAGMASVEEKESSASKVVAGPSFEKLPPGMAAIRAPMLGTFYLTPKPGAPPFVKVGSWVKEDDPVCIIEVMKLFNTVKAGIQGRVVQIFAEQGQMVEYQQVLFFIEKDPANKGSLIN